MDTKDLLSKLLSWLKSAPVWCKICLPLLLAALAIVVLLSSCGSTVRATISNKAEGVSTTVSITTSNPTSVTVTPDTDVNYKPSK